MIFPEVLGPGELAIAFGVGLLAGTVKGVVGFAMPTVLISGLSSFLPPGLALAGLILPTLVANGMQGLEEGVPAAKRTIRSFSVFILAGLALLLVGAQMVVTLPSGVLLLALGGVVSVFAFLQLVGWKPRLSGRTPFRDAVAGGTAGFIGGFSGIWGPPTVIYLTALKASKEMQIHVQGVIYTLGGVAMVGAHVASGVLRGEAATFSALMIVPAVFGMRLGTKIRDEINQNEFRAVTQVVLLLAGLNLVRRGFLG